MNYLHLYTTRRTNGIYDVFFGRKNGTCDGVIHVDIQDPKLAANHAAAAELSALYEIIHNLKINISPTGKGLVVVCSEFEVLPLKTESSKNAYLGLYSHFLATKYADAEVKWGAEKEWTDFRSEDFQEYSLNITQPPKIKESCPLLNAEVFISSHAVQRAMLRNPSITRPAQSYRALAKALQDPGLRMLKQSGMRETHNELHYEKMSQALFHSGSNLIQTIMPEDEGWSVTTCTQKVRSRSYVEND